MHAVISSAFMSRLPSSACSCAQCTSCKHTATQNQAALHSSSRDSSQSTTAPASLLRLGQQSLGCTIGAAHYASSLRSFSAGAFQVGPCDLGRPLLNTSLHSLDPRLQKFVIYTPFNSTCAHTAAGPAGVQRPAASCAVQRPAAGSVSRRWAEQV